MYALDHCSGDDLESLRAELAFKFLDRLTDASPAVANAASEIMQRWLASVSPSTPPGSIAPTPAQESLLWDVALGRDPNVAAVCGQALNECGVVPSAERLNALDAIVRDGLLGTRRTFVACWTIAGFASRSEAARDVIRRGWRDADETIAVQYIRYGRQAVLTPTDEQYLRSMVAQGTPARATAAALVLAGKGMPQLEQELSRLEQDPDAAGSLASTLWAILRNEAQGGDANDLDHQLSKYERVLPILERALERSPRSQAEITPLLTLLEPAIRRFEHLRPLLEQYAQDPNQPPAVVEVARRALKRLAPPEPLEPVEPATPPARMLRINTPRRTRPSGVRSRPRSLPSMDHARSPGSPRTPPATPSRRGAPRA